MRDQSVAAQALRWRLTRSPAGLERRRVLAALVEADALACLQQSERGACVSAACLKLDSPAVSLQLAYLLNAIASDAAGRTYLLLPGSSACHVLLQILIRAPGKELRKRGGVSLAFWAISRLVISSLLPTRGW
jgi:hypothetical protein